MLFWIGAALCGYLGYRLLEWWVPSAVSIAVVVVQAVLLRALLSTGGGYELLAFSLLINLLMFHATFSIGRALGQRLRRRKGV